MAVIDKAIDVLNEQSTSASSAALQTTSNVQTVAAGAEELYAPVVKTQKLLLVAQAMNGIVSLIQKIAEQVNLLFLNATIEAARLIIFRTLFQSLPMDWLRSRHSLIMHGTL